VPVHVEGTDRILRKGRSLPTPAATRITFGTPLRPDEGEDSRRLAVRIEAEVAVLADEASSNWWEARKRSHLGTTPPLQGPETASWRRTWALGERDRRVRRQRRRWPDLTK
jgi:hypothetical protein